MKPLLSEFSYGYALTEELATGAFGPLTGAPIFPSLAAEGTVGYDIQLPLVGAPLFLQFKLSDKLVRSNAGESAEFGIPYYRFHLRSRKYSMQHDLLQNLQASGEEVYYAAPLFHEQDELNDRYLKRTVFASSALFEPLDIDVPDDDEHYVSFSEMSAFFVRCSNSPKRIAKKTAALHVGERIAKRLAERRVPITSHFFAVLSDRLLRAARNENVAFATIRPEAGKSGSALMHAARRSAYLARTLFDAELFIVR